MNELICQKTAGDTSAAGRIDLLAPAHVGPSAYPSMSLASLRLPLKLAHCPALARCYPPSFTFYVADPSAPFAVARLPLQETPNVKVSSMHQERLMMSAIEPSAAALEAGLMEQEQRYPCSAVLP